MLSEFSKELKDLEVIMIMDGASWHKSEDLVIPKNIQIIHLPPYSPELNPVERLWLYIKKAVLYNKIYENLADLENIVCDFIKNLNSNTIAQLCSVSYLTC